MCLETEPVNQQLLCLIQSSEIQQLLRPIQSLELQSCVQNKQWKLKILVSYGKSELEDNQSDAVHYGQLYNLDSWQII